jgi:hypothetical protein
MFGIAPLSAVAAYVLVDMPIYFPCVQAPVEVSVEFVKKDNPVVYDVTSVELTRRFGKSVDSSMFTDGRWMMGGVTVIEKGGLTASTQLGISQMRISLDDTTCFTVNKIVYTINYAPSVYVASDFRTMGCRASAIEAHELRHVDTDVQTITDYVPVMKTAIENYAATLHPQGPMPGSDVAAQKQRMASEIGHSVDAQWQELLGLRRQRQATIDTMQNYLRDTALCPGQFPKFDGTR